MRVVGDSSKTQADFSARYVDVLEKEIAATASVYGAESRHLGGLRTLYFGGGTPSLIPPPLLNRLIRCMEAAFGLAGDAEVTMEMDPGTFDSQKLQGFLSAGVNRISLGVQSLDDDVLTAAGRPHSAKDALEAVERVHRAGVDNWSMDLMGGLPSQSPGGWEKTLEETIGMRPAHVSVYDLQVEASTAFGKWYSEGEAPLPSLDSTADQFIEASRRLGAAGYEHYEVSNYAARPALRSQHNSAYWKRKPFLGLGMGATSFLSGRRYSRPRTLEAYEAWVDALCSNDVMRLSDDPLRFSLATADGEQLPSFLDTVQEDIMLALRTKDGLDLHAFLRRAVPPVKAASRTAPPPPPHGGDGGAAVSLQRAELKEAVMHALGPFIDAGLVSLTPASVITLEDPHGFLLSNQVISSVFAAVESLVDE